MHALADSLLERSRRLQSPTSVRRSPGEEVLLRPSADPTSAARFGEKNTPSSNTPSKAEECPLPQGPCFPAGGRDLK